MCRKCQKCTFGAQCHLILLLEYLWEPLAKRRGLEPLKYGRPSCLVILTPTSLHHLSHTLGHSQTRSSELPRAMRVEVGRLEFQSRPAAAGSAGTRKVLKSPRCIFLVFNSMPLTEPLPPPQIPSSLFLAHQTHIFQYSAETCTSLMKAF